MAPGHFGLQEEELELLPLPVHGYQLQHGEMGWQIHQSDFRPFPYYSVSLNCPGSTLHKAELLFSFCAVSLSFLALSLSFPWHSAAPAQGSKPERPQNPLQAPLTAHSLSQGTAQIQMAQQMKSGVTATRWE